MSDLVIGRIVFTPGPWRVDFDRFDKAHAIRGRNGSLVATVPVSSLGLSSANLLSERKHRATDANLIAAAPELLRVLQNVADYFADSRCTAEVFDALRTDISNAIAKAEGR